MSKLDEQGLAVLVGEINKSVNTKINSSLGGGIDTSNLATKNELNTVKAELNTTNAKIEGLKASGITIDDTDNLFTSSNIEEALKEVMTKANNSFQQASDGKDKIATAITGKGVSASGSDTFNDLSNKIGQIPTGKRVATGVGVPLGITAFYYADGSGDFESRWNYSIPLEEIGFRPSTLISTYSNGTVQYTTMVYSIGNFITDEDSNNSFTLTTMVNSSSGTTSYHHFKTRYWLSGNEIEGNKIFIPLMYSNVSDISGKEFRWVAYE